MSASAVKDAVAQNENSTSTEDSVKEELLALREQITATDEKLIKLLGQRQKLILGVGDLKRRNNLPVRDLVREKALLETLVLKAQAEKVPTDLIVKIYQAIFDASVADQESLDMDTFAVPISKNRTEQ